MEKEIKVRALKTQQGKGINVYAFFLPGKSIMQIAEISRIVRDSEEKLTGFQRKEIKTHIRSIVQYLKNSDIIFPNSITLAFTKNKINFIESRGSKVQGITKSSVSGTLTIPVFEGESGVAWIVDGQQRSLALEQSNKKNLFVPIIAFEAPDLDTQREQFILVNKAKPLPRRLINELLPEFDRELPKDLAMSKIPSELCDLLNKDPKSPFYRLINRLSYTDKTGRVITDTAIIKMIEHSIDNPIGVLSQFRSLGEEPTDTQAMYKTLVTFWSAVKKVFPDAWGLSPRESRLMHSAGIKAMGFLMDKIFARISKRKLTKAIIIKSLDNISTSCAWTEGHWPDCGYAWNEIEDTPRVQRSLRDQLLKLDSQYNLNK